MGNIIFTKEEKEKIRKSLNLVLDDIRELWKVAETDRIYIRLDDFTERGGTYYLNITNNRVTLEYPNWDTTTRFNLETRTLNLVNRIPSSYELTLSFIENYEQIRQHLEKEIKKGLRKKGLGFSELEKINQKYDKEATIELDLPETNNQHQIEVEEKDGKKIGIINFGNRTIKIVTTGDIILVNKTEIEQHIEPQEKKNAKVKCKRVNITSKKKKK